jgi:hypothetical protein
LVALQRFAATKFPGSRLFSFAYSKSLNKMLLYNTIIRVKLRRGSKLRYNRITKLQQNITKLYSVVFFL